MLEIDLIMFAAGISGRTKRVFEKIWAAFLAPARIAFACTANMLPVVGEGGET